MCVCVCVSEPQGSARAREGGRVGGRGLDIRPIEVSDFSARGLIADIRTLWLTVPSCLSLAAAFFLTASTASTHLPNETEYRRPAVLYMTVIGLI